MSLTIQTNELVKKYGNRTVVNHVSFNVRQGEIVGLLGPNGAGKTTSFYQVVGLIKPDEGDVFLNDINITRLPMYKRAKMGIGYLPQEASVFRKLSVEDNILAVLEMTSLSKKEQRAKLETLLDEFRLQHVRKNLGDTLSGGERRRTEIARALAVDPKFVLLDEPFAGVDPIAVEDIQTIVAKLKYKNIGILITDHNVNETLSICDRAYLLIDGKIFQHGTAEELAGDEQVRRLYLGRNFELKRKDYLHDEAKDESIANAERKINPDKIVYSLESALQMLERLIASRISIQTLSDSANGNDHLGMLDLFSFINELKPALIKINAEKKLPKVTELCNKIPALNISNYLPPRGISYMGWFGRIFGTALYARKVNKLNADLQEVRSCLSNIKLIVDNPEFAEHISV